MEICYTNKTCRISDRTGTYKTEERGDWKFDARIPNKEKAEEMLQDCFYLFLVSQYLGMLHRLIHAHYILFITYLSADIVSIHGRNIISSADKFNTDFHKCSLYRTIYSICMFEYSGTNFVFKINFVYVKTRKTPIY